jgi:hypothetical protein
LLAGQVQLGGQPAVDNKPGGLRRASSTAVERPGRTIDDRAGTTSARREAMRNP